MTGLGEQIERQAVSQTRHVTRVRHPWRVPSPDLGAVQTEQTGDEDRQQHRPQQPTQAVATLRACAEVGWIRRLTSCDLAEHLDQSIVHRGHRAVKHLLGVYVDDDPSHSVDPHLGPRVCVAARDDDRRTAEVRFGDVVAGGDARGDPHRSEEEDRGVGEVYAVADAVSEEELRGRVVGAGVIVLRGVDQVLIEPELDRQDDRERVPQVLGAHVGEDLVGELLVAFVVRRLSVVFEDLGVHVEAGRAPQELLVAEVLSERLESVTSDEARGVRVRRRLEEHRGFQGERSGVLDEERDVGLHVLSADAPRFLFDVGLADRPAEQKVIVDVAAARRHQATPGVVAPRFLPEVEAVARRRVVIPEDDDRHRRRRLRLLRDLVELRVLRLLRAALTVLHVLLLLPRLLLALLAFAPGTVHPLVHRIRGVSLLRVGSESEVVAGVRFGQTRHVEREREDDAEYGQRDQRGDRKAIP